MKFWVDDFSRCYVDGGGGCIYDVIKSECNLDTPDIVCLYVMI